MKSNVSVKILMIAILISFAMEHKKIEAGMNFTGLGFQDKSMRALPPPNKNAKDYRITKYFLRNISNRIQMQQIINELLESEDIFKFNIENINHLKKRGAELKFYVPGGYSSKKNKYNLIPSKILPDSYLFFNFEIPKSEQEELNILQSVEFIKSKREIAKQYHPDKNIGKMTKAKIIWWQVYSAMSDLMDARRKWLIKKGALLTTRQDIIDRSATDMVVRESLSNGYMLFMPDNAMFTYIAGYVRLPDFKNKEEAKKWGMTVRYNEQVYRMMKARLGYIQEEIVKEERGLTDIVNFTGIANYSKLQKLASQFEFYVYAIEIMLRHKDEIDKAQVGASMYAGSVRIK